MEVLVGLLTTAVSGLAGAVVYLFRACQAEFADVKAKLKDCEEDRQRLWEAKADK